MSKPKICFFSLNAFPLFSNTGVEFIGGAELQQVLIAKKLAEEGYILSFVIFDEGNECVEVGKIHFYKSIPRAYSLSGIRSVYSGMRKLWKALDKADADVYFQRCSGMFTGLVALFCTIKRRKFVYQMACDLDADGSFISQRGIHEKLLYSFGVKRADNITAQNENQQRLLRKRYGRESVLIKNVFPLEAEAGRKTGRYVLWVGTFSNIKRPMMFLDLAKKFPAFQFRMIGKSHKGDQHLYEQIINEAKSMPNLELMGFIPHDRMKEQYSQASVFVNTSEAEGFPNTFLEAWSMSVPVLSLAADPDEIICRHELGLHSRNFDKMVEDLRSLLENDSLRKQMGMNGRKYVEDNHDIDNVMKDYCRLLDAFLLKER